MNVDRQEIIFFQRHARPERVLFQDGKWLASDHATSREIDIQEALAELMLGHLLLSRRPLVVPLGERRVFKRGDGMEYQKGQTIFNILMAMPKVLREKFRDIQVEIPGYSLPRKTESLAAITLPEDLEFVGRRRRLFLPKSEIEEIVDHTVIFSGEAVGLEALSQIHMGNTASRILERSKT